MELLTFLMLVVDFFMKVPVISFMIQKINFTMEIRKKDIFDMFLVLHQSISPLISQPKLDQVVTLLHWILSQQPCWILLETQSP